MSESNKHSQRTLVSLSLVVAAALVAPRAASADSPSEAGFAVLAQVQLVLNQKLSQYAALSQQIGQQTQFRDRLLAQANQPYLACPHHRDYQSCTHTALKAQYVRQCQLYRMAAKTAQATLNDLQNRRAVLQTQIANLQIQGLQACAALIGGG
jgi:hypothetical protein